MKICAVCKRESHGFGFIQPPLRASNPNNRKMMKYFCSMNCQEIFSKIYKEKNMIDLTKNEKEAIESALKPVGEYVAEIGMDRPLSSYSREEVSNFKFNQFRSLVFARKDKFISDYKQKLKKALIMPI